MTSSSTAEQADAKDTVRENIYSNLYGVRYKYSTQKKSKPVNPEDLPFEDGAVDHDINPFDPASPPRATKGFIKATDFDPESRLPFGSSLDAPLR